MADSGKACLGVVCFDDARESCLMLSMTLRHSSMSLCVVSMLEGGRGNIVANLNSKANKSSEEEGLKMPEASPKIPWKMDINAQVH